MRIVNEPKVYLLARPQLYAPGLNAFLADQGLQWPTPQTGVSDAAQLVEAAGRCCYMSFGAKAGSKTNQDYVNNLLGRKPDGSFRDGPAHGSVVEHPCWSFIIVGAGRGFSHEQVRHRVGWAYSQLSTRYCDFEREDQEGTWDPGFVIPPLAQLSPQARETFSEKLKQSQQAYTELLGLIEGDLKGNAQFMAKLGAYTAPEQKRMLRKAARGAARDILPIATEAIMVMSANARSIWNTIYLRASEHAEGAIRSVYVQIARIMCDEFPELFHSLEFGELWDGSTAVRLPRDKL